MTSTLILLDPTAPPPTGGPVARRALAGLSGKTVGFIDNTKPNFNHLVDDLAGLLVEKYGVSAIVKRSKAAATIGAEEALIDELARDCHLVIAGSGD